ncbi:acyltransferase family-domain-containing protein [Xylogone sp. PMI_703]|nr:acyltransferase family-domain-containing protein [Xylogone sp. PMI_703]
MGQNNPQSPYTNGNVLESGYWDEIKPIATEPPPSSLSTQAARYATDLFRPAYFSRSSSNLQAHNKPLRRTAWLDGLRGFAAFLVYIQHHQLWARGSLEAKEIFESGYGYKDRYYFVAFPGIRTFFTGGHFAVTVFFVISGYVLSAKPLQLIQAGEYTKLGDNLGSALFRRWMRLYLPMIAVTWLYVTICWIFGIWVEVIEWKQTYAEELWNWYCELKNFSFVFRSGGEPWFVYHFHTWSIAVEFKGSVSIYTALMAFSRCRKNARLLCEVALIYYFLYIADGAHCAMFIAGMLLCDLDLLASKGELPSWMTSLGSHKNAIFYSMLAVAVYLSGVPSADLDINKVAETPGWYYLSLLKPQAVFDYKWFYLFIASVCLVASIPRVPWLKSFFETKFNQYLGHISFALYLVHGPVLWTIGDRIYCAVGWARETQALTLQGWINAFPLSKSGPLGFEPGVLLPHLILLPLTFWIAEIVTKVFDENSVKFAQWLYNKTLEPPVVKA